MVKMTFDKYDELTEKFKAMPNTMHDYGITRKDMETMESDPDKYFYFAMYLSTREWYQGKGDNTHVFINSDALKPVDAAFLLNEFINENIDLDNDEDGSDILDPEEEAEMRKLLGLS